MLIILGNRYKFADFELELLKKSFKEILFKSSREEITENYKLLVLNSTEQSEKDEKSLSIEEFLELYLFKILIDEKVELSLPSSNRTIKFYKRAFDFFALFCLYPIFLLLKPLVKYKIAQQAPGKLFYLQKRVGLNNKEFSCIKFRTMINDAEKDGIAFTSVDDERIFPFGKFMRKTRIDELPQLYNIYRKEMHLIGPRPERKYWIEKFEKEIPYYNQRHLVKPGITGWAQVNYRYGENLEDARQKLMYDLYYIKHFSLWLDIKILFKTAWIVFQKKGI